MGDGDLIQGLIEVFKDYLPKDPLPDSEFVKRCAILNYERKPVDIGVLHRSWAEQILYAKRKGKSKRDFVGGREQIENAKKAAEKLKIALKNMPPDHLESFGLVVTGERGDDFITLKGLEPWRLSGPDFLNCVSEWENEFDQMLKFWADDSDKQSGRREDFRKSVRRACSLIWIHATGKTVPKRLKRDAPGPYLRFEQAVFDKLGLMYLHSR